MPANAKFRIAVALLGIAFLLLNPAGVCAGTPGARSAGHPCCPQPAAPSQHGGASGACICIDRQTAAPVLPSLVESGMVAAVTIVAATDAVAVSRHPAAGLQSISPALHDRSVEFHQLLV
jgi:hypothetical protein